MAYRAWTLTFRPRAGVTDRQLSQITDWCVKTTSFHHVGVEKADDARHAHITIFRPRTTSRSNMINMIIKTAFHNSLDEQEKTRPGYLKTYKDPSGRLKSGLNICYSDDFMANYVGANYKDDQYFLRSHHLPDDLEVLTDYYPAKDDTASVRPNSLWFVNREKAWLAAGLPAHLANDINVRAMLNYWMFNDRSIEVIADPRIFTQKVKALTMFLRRDSHQPLSYHTQIPEHVDQHVDQQSPNSPGPPSPPPNSRPEDSELFAPSSRNSKRERDSE